MNSTDCFKFDRREITAAIGAKAAVGSLAFVSCLLVIFSIVWFKAYKRFGYRLILYLMIANLLLSISHVLGVIPIDYDYDEQIASVREGWETACAVFGFLNEFSMWMANCMIVWIVFYLQSSVQRFISLYRVQYYQPLNSISQSKRFGIWEICRVLIACFIMPIILNWIPFIWNMYGFSGLSCWIKLVSNDDCSDRYLSAILMFTISYGPLLLLLFYSFCALFVMIAILQWSFERYQNLLKIKVLKITARKMATLVVILLVYSSLFAVTIVNHLYSVIYPTDYPVYPLWLASALASPGQILLILPIAYVWKTFESDQGHRHQQASAESAASYASYVVEPELDDIEEPLVIEGEASCETSYEVET